MLKKCLFFLTLLLAVGEAYPYKNVKVVLIANKANQKDTLGYNFVNVMAHWTYDNLKAGKIKMWATPYKSEEMSFNTLEGMEISSKLNFADCQNIFLYEIWNSDKTQSSFTITGMSFSSENQAGEMVSFGFIDFNDIEELLKKDFVPVNENGSYGTTFYQLLMNKSYDYEIVYFKDAPIQNPNSKNPESDFKYGAKIKNKAFNRNKLNLNYVPVKQAKIVECEIRTIDYDIKSNNIIAALETYFNNNKKDLYKYGGTEIYKYFSNSKILLSECTISELWSKEGGKLYFTLQQIVPVSVGVTFTPIPIEDVERFNILIDKQSLISILKGKQYTYHLISINGVKVEENNATQYLSELKDGNWYKISTIGKQ
jgi:hypothetical protein